MVTVEWKKEEDQKWFDFLKTNLSDSRFDQAKGVYIVWHGGENPGIVCVGRGEIRERLKTHLKDQAVLKFQTAKLYMTWATVLENERVGVEKYLFEKLHPSVACELGNDEPIPVNLPWKSQKQNQKG